MKKFIIAGIFLILSSTSYAQKSVITGDTLFKATNDDGLEIKFLNQKIFNIVPQSAQLKLLCDGLPNVVLLMDKKNTVIEKGCWGAVEKPKQGEHYYIKTIDLMWFVNDVDKRSQRYHLSDLTPSDYLLAQARNNPDRIDDSPFKLIIRKELKESSPLRVTSNLSSATMTALETDSDNRPTKVKFNLPPNLSKYPQLRMWNVGDYNVFISKDSKKNILNLTGFDISRRNIKTSRFNFSEDTIKFFSYVCEEQKLYFLVQRINPSNQSVIETGCYNVAPETKDWHLTRGKYFELDPNYVIEKFRVIWQTQDGKGFEEFLSSDVVSMPEKYSLEFYQGGGKHISKILKK